MKIAFYRRRSDGALLTEAELIIAVKPNNSRYQVFLANDPARWDPGVMNMIGYDPVVASDPPLIDQRYYVLEGRKATYARKAWRQAWAQTARYPDIEDLRAQVKVAISEKLTEKRDAGLVVQGVAIKTDAGGISRLQGAVTGAKATRNFVTGGKVFKLSKAQIEAMLVAVDDFQQGLYDKAADLIGQVDASDSPAEIDLDSGW